MRMTSPARVHHVRHGCRRSLLWRRIRRNRRRSWRRLLRRRRGAWRRGSCRRLTGMAAARRARCGRGRGGHRLRRLLGGQLSLHLRKLRILQLQLAMVVSDLGLQRLNLCLQRLDVTGGSALGRGRSAGTGATRGSDQSQSSRTALGVPGLLRAAAPRGVLPVNLRRSGGGRDGRDRIVVGDAQHRA